MLRVTANQVGNCSEARADICTRRNPSGHRNGNQARGGHSPYEGLQERVKEREQSLLRAVRGALGNKNEKEKRKNSLEANRRFPGFP